MRCRSVLTRMTASYKATQKATGKQVAIKVCSEENYKYIKHEIELQSQSHHPCIVTLHECFRWKQRIFVVVLQTRDGSDRHGVHGQRRISRHSLSTVPYA